VAAQIADCLVGVVSQRLRFRPDLNIRVPECEVLVATHAVKNFIRNRDFFKIASAIETGADHGMWSFQRYRNWLDNRTNWHIPGQTPETTENEVAEAPPPRPAVEAFPLAPKPLRADKPSGTPTPAPAKSPGRIDIEPGESEFGKILKRPGE
jgi:twitching motility protein PilT